MVRTRRLIIFSAIVLVGILVLMVAHSLTGGKYFKDFFLQQLEEGIGRKIDVHRAKLVLFPRLRLELTQVAIHDRNSDDILLSAKKLDVVLRLLPLLRKQVVAKRLLIEEPILTLRRDQRGHWNFLDGVAQGGAPDEGAVQTVSRVFRIREATLIKGKVIIIDDGRSHGTRSMALESVEASLVVRAERGQADLHVSAAHVSDKGLSALSLIGRITTAPRQLLAPDDPAASQVRLQFDGNLDAANVNLRDAADFFGPRPVPEQLQGVVNVHSLVRAVPGVAGYDVLLSDLSVNLEQLALTGQASLSGLLTPQPMFAVTFAASPLQLRQLLAQLPAQWVHPQLPAIIQERAIDGTVEIVSATVTGSPAAGPQLSLTGEFRVSHAQALIGESRTPAKDVSAVVSVEAGRVRVSNLNGLYGAIHMHDSKALVSFLEAGPWLEIDIAGTMAAADLMQFLAKTVTSEQLSRTLASSRNVEGVASPTFRLVGPLNQPGGITFAGGEIIVRGVSLTNALLPERLTGLQGRFVLLDGGTKFDQVTGHLGDLALQVSGGITGGSASLFQDFLVRVKGDAGHMIQLLPANSVPAKTIEGLVSGAVVLTGPVLSPHVRGEVVLTESKVTLAGLVEKPIGAQATVEFEGMIPQDGVLLDRIELVVPPLRLPIKGKIQLGKRFAIDASLSTGTLSLSRIPEWITKGGFEAGNIEVSLDLKGKGLNWNEWRTTGWLALTNGLLNAKGAEGPIEDLYLRIHFVRNGAEIKRVSFRLLDSHLTMEGTVRNWAEKPAITARIESNQMDIDLLIPKGERSPIRDFLETLAATSTVQATVSIVRGHYHHLKFGNLSALVTIQNGVLDVDRLSSRSTSGELAGHFVVHLPRKQPAEAQVSVQATGLQVEDLLKLLGEKEGGLATGEVRVTGTLSGHGRNPRGLAPTLNGKVEALLENGRMLKSQNRALWKIISILNLPAVLQGKVDLEKEGLPYRKITATMVAKNGLFETENLIIDSPIVKMTAAGNYDLTTDQIDMVWAVSPFGSYSEFINTIPLFGRIFSGERHGLATALFSVKGSIENPEVTYLPIQSFASGVTGLAQLAFDVLKNTVMLPIDLIAPNEGKGASKDPIPTPGPAPAVP
ncbi:MAG: AsmA-like C-terminal domain-containing protein [Nitrospiraceae bacterium]|nr:AsmA-like C-terminal domain-containing protein [Nitrospiraceae bacterium]